MTSVEGSESSAQRRSRGTNKNDKQVLGLRSEPQQCRTAPHPRDRDCRRTRGGQATHGTEGSRREGRQINHISTTRVEKNKTKAKGSSERERGGEMQKDWRSQGDLEGSTHSCSFKRRELKNPRTRRDGSVAKILHRSRRGPRFGSRHPHQLAPNCL